MTYLAAFLVLCGLGAAAWALWRRDLRRVSDLRAVLEMSFLEEEAPSPDVASSLLARTGVMAERALQSTTLLARLKDTIERSDYQLSPGELVAVSVGAGFLGLVVGVGAGAPPLALILLIVGLLMPYGLVSRSVKKRAGRFEEQFPDILDLMAASLESGAGVPQALELVVAESDDPAATEFARVLTSTRLGTPFVQALQELAERLGSRDLTWTVQAIIVQQRTGGRLAEVLRIVASVMRSREEIRGELRALTAEGRLSAYVLGGLPIVFAAFLELTEPSYVRPLFSTAIGLVMVGTVSVLMAVAFGVMLRIVRIEV